MTINEELPDVLRVDELAVILRIGRNAAYDLVASRAIRSVRIGSRTIRVPKSAVLEFLKNGDAASTDGGSNVTTPEFHKNGERDES